MKEITLFHLQTCPHCRRALQYLEELRAENPAYAAVPVTLVEEQQQKALADSYDYYFVSSFFIGSRKLFEGAAQKQDVRAVLDAALAEE